jgi:hypothetical protein
MKPTQIATLLAFSALAAGTASAQTACRAETGARVNPVVELYTSEGCSSCPPADQWISQFKDPKRADGAVVLAFHVGYWDYIGWVDRFAAKSHTERQREIAAANGLRSIYTPQLVRDYADWRGWRSAGDLRGARAALAPAIQIELVKQPNGSVLAKVNPSDPKQNWSAFWATTEHNHASKVTAGENTGESLKHDFVVRQYTPVGQYSGAQSLSFTPLPAQKAHPQQVNLVIHEQRTGRTLQALSLACSG